MASGKNGFLVEVGSKQQSGKLKKLDKLCNQDCFVKEHKFFNETRGIIYLYNNDITNLESFSEGLRAKYVVSDVKEVTWIKARVDTAKVYLLTFQGDSLPQYIKITGEYTLTKVYEYKNKPLQCAKCQKCGHTLSRCNANEHTFNSCSEVPHPGSVMARILNVTTVPGITGRETMNVPSEDSKKKLLLFK